MKNLYESIFSGKAAITAEVGKILIDNNIPKANQYHIEVIGQGTGELYYNWIFAESTRALLIPELKPYVQMEIGARSYNRLDPWEIYLRVAKNPYIMSWSHSIAFELKFKRTFKVDQNAIKYAYSILQKISKKPYTINKLYEFNMKESRDITMTDINKICK